MRTTVVLGGLLCAAPLASVAAEPSAALAADPVVVTATRTARTADETLASVTVITAEEIERSQAVDVLELLRFHAGIDIGRNGGFGQSASVFLRGTESNHTLVLLDGVRINPGTIGGPALQFIDPAAIERIEIVRGPRSALYGSDAIGGVIQIFTRRGAAGTSVRATGGAGSHDTREASVGAHRRSGRWRVGVDASTFRTDGFPTRRESTLDRGFRNATASAYAGFDAGALDVEISHWQAQGKAEYLDFAFVPLDQDFDNAVTAATVKANPSPAWAATLRLSRMRDELRQNQSSDFLRTRRNVLDWQNDLQAGNHLLTVGALLSRERAETLSFGSAFDVSTDQEAVYVQDQWSLGRYRLLAALRHTDDERFGGHSTGELAAGYDLGPRARVHASIATGFRAPDATDRFGPGGNPDLQPERSRNTEVGWRFRPAPEHTLSLAVFDNEIDNMITFVDPDGFMNPIPGRNENLEQARIRGIEASHTWSGTHWIVETSIVAQSPENRATGQTLPRRARRHLSLRGSYRTGPVALGGALLAASERRDSDFNDNMLAGYAVVSLFGEYELRRNLVLSARVENVLDKDYVLAHGFNTPGRTLFFNVRYTSHASD